MEKKSYGSSRRGKRIDTNSKNISRNFAAELEALKNMKDSDIDYSDIPQKLDWHNAEVGKFYRPVKKLVSLRIDADLLDWFKCHNGKGDKEGYTSKINQALRRYVARETMMEERKHTKSKK